MAVLSEIDLTVTNTAKLITLLSGAANFPTQVQYVQIINPSSSAYIAFTINGQTPVINGTGITIAPYGSETFILSSQNALFPLSNMTLISSVATQSVTILWG
jgi:hypothetical protein